MASIKGQTSTGVHSLDVCADIKTADGKRTDERLFVGYSVRRDFEHSNLFAARGLRFERDRFGGIERLSANMSAQVIRSPTATVQVGCSRWPGIAADALHLGAKRQPVLDSSLAPPCCGSSATHFASAGTSPRHWRKATALIHRLRRLTTDIYDRFALRLSVAASVETEPPPDRKKVDTYSHASLVYTFEP